ncbi:hypothetical protein AU210_012226 [Fusarium oxysporum f. sp. radicis-cucumerinum]|uniref:Uncharacterized protein n=1 Tax=Fusarium oxysporum f. sp. radicis-cucumerinum TaxID=327505 RepID=A0A2H3G7R8_FUSOX|nr:hypothetical protein AU210_012226 [Fusarium oxysporum f. sp. radicis-cucumerinum]
MLPHSAYEQREAINSQFHDNTDIHQGNVQGKVYYSLPHPPAPAEVGRVIPYPRNEDLVHRPGLIDRLDELLPQSVGSRSAALWGLGGSGKTQIALDYAYRRCDTDDKCCVFWVHADNEATFTSDYKTIGKKLGVDERLDGSDLLDAVCSAIEARSKWVMVVDNADDLRLFGVGQQANDEEMNDTLYKYVPHGSQGRYYGRVETRILSARLLDRLAVLQGDSSTVEREAGVDALLEELQCLPLAISQAGAYMRRMSMTAEQYLGFLRQGKTRWDMLKASDADRHRRPEVSNSMLETSRISTKRIRAESEMSYRMLHVVAYVDSQDIPYELIAAVADRCDNDKEDSVKQATEIEVLEAITRLKEFSFLRLRQTEQGERRYEMHKLVQEALRYGLRVRGTIEKILGETLSTENESENSEAYYAGTTLQIVDGLFPPSEPSSWARCEQYMKHAIRVGDWAEVSRMEVKAATLLQRVSYFLYDRGRWREREPVDSRAWVLRRKVLGEKHPDTIRSMADLAATYHAQGRHDEDEEIAIKVLELRREVLGEKHLDTIRSMAALATTYHEQGRYVEAEGIDQEVLDLRRELLGEKHPDTIRSLAELATTYHAQGRYDEALQLHQTALGLRRHVLVENHPDTMQSVAYLASIREALQQLPSLV